MWWSAEKPVRYRLPQKKPSITENRWTKIYWEHLNNWNYKINCRYALVIPSLPWEPLILQVLACCDYNRTSLVFFKLISAWSLEVSCVSRIQIYRRWGWNITSAARAALDDDITRSLHQVFYPNKTMARKESTNQWYLQISSIYSSANKISFPSRDQLLTQFRGLV